MAVITLTRHGDDAYLQELLRAGVSGYVLKQSAPSELLQAIRVAAAGGQYLDSTLTARVTAGFLGREGKRVGKSGAQVSERESEVLRLIASGYSNKEIAARLDPEREDRRGPQGERHAKARSDGPHRHRQVRDPAGLAEGRIGKIPRIIRCDPYSSHATQPVNCTSFGQTVSARDFHGKPSDDERVKGYSHRQVKFPKRV